MRLAHRMAVALVTVVAMASVGIGADAVIDPMVIAVREACAVAGSPRATDDVSAFGDPPLPIPEAPAPPTIDAIEAINRSIEAWAAWAWRIGAASAVHGVAGPETRAAVESASREILAGCDRSMAATDALVSRLDAVDANQDDQRIARVLLERRITIPLRAARAALWAGASRMPGDPGVADLVGSAAAIAGAVDATQPGVALDRAALIAQVALVLGNAEGAIRALAEADRALRALGPDTPDGSRIDVAMTQARAMAATNEPARARTALRLIAAEMTDESGTINFATAALIAGTRARITLNEGLPARSAAVRGRAAAEAAGFFRALIDADGTSEPSAARRRAAIYESLRGIGARLNPGDPWPGLVVAASAERAIGHPNTDPGAMIAWLNDWVAIPSAQADPDIDQVRLQLARVLATTGDPVDAGRAAAMASAFAETHPEDDRAGAALALACAAAAESGSAQKLGPDRVIAILRMADEAEYDVPNRDRWRVALMRATEGSTSTSDPDAFRTAFEAQITIAQRITTEAQAREAATRLVSLVEYAGYGLPQHWKSRESSAITPDVFQEVADAVAEHAEAVGLAREAVRVRAEACMVSGRYAEAAAMATPPTADVERDLLLRATAMAGDAQTARDHLAALRRDQRPGLTYLGVWIGRAAWAEIGDRANLLPEVVQEQDDIDRLATALTIAMELPVATEPFDRHTGIALVLAGRNAEAQALLTPVCAADPTDALARLALADALIGIGDDAAAFPMLRAIAAEGEAQRRHDRAYFRAWVRMLQVLDRQNSDGSRTEAITREVFRLRQLPPVGRFDDLRDALDALATRYPSPQR